MSRLAWRASAGAWFALISTVPVVFYFMFLWREAATQQDILFFWIFIGVPLLLSGICGAWLGSSILDPAKVKSPGQAMLRGLIVALVAFALFFVAAPLIIALTSKNTTGLSGWAFVFIVATVYMGWLVALIGAVGGALLYMYRVFSAIDKRQRQNSAAGGRFGLESSESARQDTDAEK